MRWRTPAKISEDMGAESKAARRYGVPGPPLSARLVSAAAANCIHEARHVTSRNGTHPMRFKKYLDVVPPPRQVTIAQTHSNRFEFVTHGVCQLEVFVFTSLAQGDFVNQWP